MMLWRLALHSGFLHPDFIRDRLTEKQLYEIGWYWELHPFGHDIDHLMLAKIVTSMAGGNPMDYMPIIEEPLEGEEQIQMFPGAVDYAQSQGIEIGDH